MRITKIELFKNKCFITDSSGQKHLISCKKMPKRYFAQRLRYFLNQFFNEKLGNDTLTCEFLNSQKININY